MAVYHVDMSAATEAASKGLAAIRQNLLDFIEEFARSNIHKWVWCARAEADGGGAITVRPIFVLRDHEKKEAENE
jgi:hypothetical protein